MSILIDAKSVASDKIPQPKLHQLPCTISYDGFARVSTFFVIRSESNLQVGQVPGWQKGDSTVGLESSFRGRALKGTKCQIPQGYQGVILEKSQRDSDDVLMRTRVKFDEFIVWGHDDAPQSFSDPLLKSVQGWLPLADAVSERILN